MQRHIQPGMDTDDNMDFVWNIRFMGESDGRLVEEGKLEEYLQSIPSAKLENLKDIRKRNLLK